MSAEEGKKKRGRKRTKDLYFGPDQENAVRLFLSSEDYEFRNRIYNKHLRHPLEKMVESIIRTYKLYRNNVSFEEIHTDTLSFLHVKMEKFNPEKGKKAYSYFGTVVKNHLLGMLIKSHKNMKTVLSYEDVSSSIEENPDMVYYIDEYDPKKHLTKFILDIVESIKLELETVPNLKENEKRVGKALIILLEDWETLFSEGEGNNKYKKNLILYELREITSLSTKEIRIAMKRYKKIYNVLKSKLDD